MQRGVSVPQRGGTSRRVLAAFGALIGIVTAMLAPTAGAQTTDPGTAGTDPGAAPDVTPQADVGTGAFQACSGLFGNGKVGRVEVSVDGAVPSPPLTFPADVQIVADVSVAGGPSPVTCIPDVVTQQFWDDEVLWGSFGDPLPPGNYIWVPQNATCPSGFPPMLCPPPSDPTQDVLSVVLRMVGAPGQYVITSGTVNVVPVQTGYTEDDEIGRVFPFALATAQVAAIVAEPRFTG